MDLGGSRLGGHLAKFAICFFWFFGLPCPFWPLPLALEGAPAPAPALPLPLPLCPALPSSLLLPSPVSLCLAFLLLPFPCSTLPWLYL